MPEQSQLTENEWHKKFAVEIFNSIWGFIGKNNRTAEEDEKMLQMAYASCYHWSFVGTAINQARGEWMISHVAILLERPTIAAHHARSSLRICEENSFGDFDLAYAYETVARAAALNKDLNNFNKYYLLAEQAGNRIKKQEDRELFQSDLQTGPWFGAR